MSMRLRVLIAEDSEDDTKLLVRALAKEGFEVSAQRVETVEAMQAALGQGAWDAVLSDHTMPEFSALLALDTLKQSGLDLPFIIVSGLIGEDVAVEAMRAGAHDYIMKGNLRRLAPAIRRELREAAVRRARRQADEALRLAYAELETRVGERTAELAQANEELRLHQQREIAALKEVDRQKDEFISIAAHELKTPITSLQGFAQIVLRELRKTGSLDPVRLARAMERIELQSKRLTSLIEQLLNLSRLQSDKLMLSREEVHLSSLAESAIADVQFTYPARVIELQKGEADTAIVDPLRVEQVLFNLLDNAIKFSPPDTRLEVAVDGSEPGFVEVSVRDRGAGIPREHRERIFERFYQAEPGRHYGGMGIGLFISREIVETHGGSMRVEQPEDGGSRFVVRLPRGEVE